MLRILSLQEMLDIYCYVVLCSVAELDFVILEEVSSSERGVKHDAPNERSRDTDLI